MTTYKIVVKNPIIDRDVMTVETDNRALAFSEAAQLSRLHGLAQIEASESKTVVARFRYGVEEAARK